MKVSDIGQETIRKAWGAPLVVTLTAYGELFEHGENISLDSDDQIGYVACIGVLAGELHASGKTADEFLKTFEEKILNS